MKSKKEIKKLQNALMSLKARMFIQRTQSIGNNCITVVNEIKKSESIIGNYLEIVNYIIEDDNTDFDDLIKTVLG